MSKFMKDVWICMSILPQKLPRSETLSSKKIDMWFVTAMIWENTQLFYVVWDKYKTTVLQSQSKHKI